MITIFHFTHIFFISTVSDGKKILYTKGNGLEINMQKKVNIKSNASVKNLIICVKLLILFVVFCSSLTVASTVPDSSLASVSPEFVKCQSEKMPTQTVSFMGHKAGYVPSPVDLSHLKHTSTVKALAKVSFPAYYDLRIMNKVTPVKNQGLAGCCWAFAACASLESNLKPGEAWDFSENNLKNVLSNASPAGFDYSEGGDETMSIAYLARWSGPVNESDDPFSASSVYSPNELGLPVQKHVQDVIFLPDMQGPLDYNLIKSAIQNYGAVHSVTFMADGINNYYNRTTKSHYYDGNSSPNHEVAIVGWDDNFDKNNFTRIPPGDGAFIVKNSWGSTWGENGYFYVSYYDSNIGTKNSIFTAESSNNYKYIYQYDPLGWTSTYGYNNQTCWCANIFTVKSEEILKAVSFYATDSNCNYEIYIYTNPNSGPLNQSGPVFTQSGVSTTAGYHTVRLNTGILLQANQKFSVVLKPMTPGYNYPVAIEYPLSGYSSKAKANTGESFVSPNGNRWTDLTTTYSNTNVCIKAFTDAGTPLPVVANISFNPQVIKVNPHSSQSLRILMDKVPANGLASYNITISVLNPTIANITAVSPPDWAGVSNTSIVPSSSVWIKAVNLGQVHAGDTNVSLGVINLTGIKEGSSDINIVSTEMNADNGDLINPSVIASKVTVVLLPIFPGCTKTPTDLNNDGFYEDINGNGRWDFADIATYYNSITWITQNGLVTYFDYNNNGRIDFSDVVRLYNMQK